jgi:hypothetical protein
VPLDVRKNLMETQTNICKKESQENGIHFKLDGNWHYLNRNATLQVD